MSFVHSHPPVSAAAGGHEHHHHHAPSPSSGYWICPSCNHHNLRQISLCLRCDAPRGSMATTSSMHVPRQVPAAADALPASLSNTTSGAMIPPQSSAAAGAASTTYPRNYGQYSPPGTQQQQQHLAEATTNGSFLRRPMSTPASAATPDQQTSRLASSADLRASLSSPGTYLGGNSTPTMQQYVNTSLTGDRYTPDAEGKNAVIAKLELHVQSMIEQQKRQKRAHEAEIAKIDTQVQQAVEAHRLVMVEYRKCSTELADRKSELALCHAELAQLRGKVSGDAKQLAELSQAHHSEMEALRAEARDAKTAAEGFRRQLAELTSPTNSQFDRPSSAQSTSTTLLPGPQALEGVAPDTTAAARSAVVMAELSARNDDLASTVERLQASLEENRAALATAKDHYAEDLRRIVRESIESNERAVAHVTAELLRVQHLADADASKARDVATTEQENTQATVNQLRVQALEAEVKELTLQREALRSEARESIVREQWYRQELSHLGSRVTNGDDAVDGSPLVEPVPPLDDVTSSDMATAHVEEVRRRLRNAITALRQKDATIGKLRQQLDTQSASMDVMSETVRGYEKASLNATATTNSDRHNTAVVEDLRKKLDVAEEEVEALQGRLNFEGNELRKQVTQLQAKLKMRDDDLKELSEENEALADQLREAMSQNQQQQQQPESTSSPKHDEVVALQKEIEQLKSDVALHRDARDRQDDLLEVKDRELEHQRHNLMETITRLTEEAKAEQASSAKLREELDTLRLQYMDSETVLRDALYTMRLDQDEG